ncbi:hypothetical protein GCM10023185_30420 [Hymenobacter saemangeumensis]|uniref:DUF2029 domain-containing protein n=1 Tax=Hymenobacter saemangeumensis TaxID=1084522 RepID=A0ABP8ILH8_9BACT
MPRFFLVLLVLLALFNSRRPLREARPGPDRPMDFRTCYVGQHVLRQGQNPYDDATLKQGWQQLVAQEQLLSRSQPGLPNLPFLYPPWAAALFGLSIGQLPYSLAWPLWYALALLSLGLLVWCWHLLLSKEAGNTPWWQFLVAALALKGTVPALLTGQPAFAALALGTGALLAATRWPARPWAPWLAGVLLGLAAYKVTLLLPFVCWFLWRKEWKPLVVAALVVAGLSAVAFAWADAPADMLPSYQQLLAQVRAQSFDPADPDYPLTQGLTLRLELGNVLEWLRPGSSAWHPLLHGLLWLGTLLRLGWLRRQGYHLATWYVFLLTGALTLLTTYHLYYDALLLLPLLAFARRQALSAQLLLLVLLLPLLLPLNGLAQALGNPPILHFVYFLMPLSLLGVLLLLLARPVQAGRSE